ncbi:YL1 nuclear protein [Diplocarpon rosae]|nr:YL1 nuclear protein [Diplocarpon rosae]
MAEDEEAPGANTPARTDESEQSGSDSESEDEQPQVQWLATGREKRSTAGNRLNNLLQQEEEDDELELLFAEADDDAGFSDNEADSDVQMDSSSDEEDQGPAAGEDDMEGEKELQKQARAEKAKKRKLDGGMPKGLKKRVKIDPTASHAPPPRPKKKSERASWIPTAEEAPTRASARGTTKQSKEQLHMQMVDREIKRLNHGLGEWVGGRLRKVGKHLVIEEKEKPTKKRKAAEMEEEGDSAVGTRNGGKDCKVYRGTRYGSRTIGICY